jgi:hypothetical protein
MDQKFDRALAELEKARSLPMRPEHRAKFDRLDLLAQYARNFQSALAEAIGALQVGEEIAVGTSTMVGVVQTAGQRITVRDQGANRTYTVDKLPAGLAIAIADKWLKKDDPVSFVLKGAYLATEKDAGPDRVTRARDFFAEAGRRDASFADLGKVLDDTYELEKEPQP